MRVSQSPVSAISSQLGRLCREQFEALGFPTVEFLSVRVDSLWSERFGSEGKQLLYVVTAEVDNPAMVRGSCVAYKGSYKERVEGALQARLDDFELGSMVHVEIVGRNDGALDAIVPLEALVARKKASAKSPLVATARRYGIPGALLHGRHLIGPSPALASLVRQIVIEDESVQTVLEMFGGTGIAAKVATTESTLVTATVLEIDEAKLSFLRGHLDLSRVAILNSSAFDYTFDRQYDLVIADPFYEHTLELLMMQGHSLRENSRRLLLASGSVEDVGWNATVQRSLKSLGFEPREAPMFGQMIFDCAPR